MISIAIDCRMINAGGIGTYLKNVIPGLLESGQFKVTVMGVRDELQKYSWFSRTTFVSLTSKILSIAEQFELPFKVPRCDLYWSPNINGSIFPTRATKRVTTIHDVFHLAHPHLFSAVKLLYIKAIIRASIARSTRIITVSNFSRSEIIKYTGCPEDKIAVTSNAVNEEFNSGVSYTVISTPYILFVGNVKPHKNLALALQAFKELKLKDYRFLIVGKKDGFITADLNLSKIISGIEEKVVFTGWVDEQELRNYYANARLFLFPSKYEGFGIPILEAMKFNLPIIASNTSSIPEVGGDAIIYFDPNSVTDLKIKIEFALTTNYRVNQEAYRDRLKKFTWINTIRQHIDVFTKQI